jgi:hypothetical protein
MFNTATASADSTATIFWGEMAPCEHLVQIYQTDAVFLQALEGFVCGGIQAQDGVIVIATRSHLHSLENRVLARGIDLNAARDCDQYVALDAEETLARFMVNQWPDDRLFEQVVTELLDRVGRAGRRVRAFGEMVALLWAEGLNGAVVRLEHLWHRFCREKGFSLFCAYPRIGFTADMGSSIQEICAVHSRVLPG